MPVWLLQNSGGEAVESNATSSDGLLELGFLISNPKSSDPADTLVTRSAMPPINIDSKPSPERNPFGSYMNPSALPSDTFRLLSVMPLVRSVRLVSLVLNVNVTDPSSVDTGGLGGTLNQSVAEKS